MKIINFQGDLTDNSAETKQLEPAKAWLRRIPGNVRTGWSWKHPNGGVFGSTDVLVWPPRKLLFSLWVIIFIRSKYPKIV